MTFLKLFTRVVRLAPLSQRRTVLAARLQASSPHRIQWNQPTIRLASSKSPADEKMEEITELYGTARDEFEIAMEETEKMTVYAQDDRDAARAELEKLKAAFKEVTEGPDAELGKEIKDRVGPRIRELESAVSAMEELAMNQD